MSIKGMDSMLRKLNALGGNSHQAVKRGVQQATSLVQGDAKMLAPVADVDGGTLRNSIKESVSESDGAFTGKVSTNLEYASYVEFGTGQRGEQSPSPPKADMDLAYRHDWAGMEAQPYLYPAISQNRETIKELIADSVRKEIKKLGG